MTDALARALNGGRPGRPPRIERVKIQTASPLTVLLPSGATVGAIPITGLTYPANGNAIAIYLEGGIPFALPIA